MVPNRTRCHNSAGACSAHTGRATNSSKCSSLQTNHSWPRAWGVWLESHSTVSVPCDIRTSADEAPMRYPLGHGDSSDAATCPG